MPEVEGIEKRWALFKNVPELVDEKFEYGREYATNAFRIANETIQKLSILAESLTNLDVNVVIGDITPPVTDDFVATVPVTPIIELQMPDDLTESDEVDVAIRDKLLDDIRTGGPAIPLAVETAIFNREVERALLIHKDTIDNIANEWSIRGFTFPNMLLASLIAQAEIDYANKRSDISRDIAIKSFELSDQNTRFAVDKGIQWYGQRIQVYQTKVQAEVARVEAIVKKFIGEVEVYKGSAQVYTSLIDTKIKLFDSQVRAALARADLLIKDAEIDMKNYEVINNLKINAMHAISSVAAQLIAGALSSVSAGVHLSASNASDYRFTTNPSY